MHHVFPNDLLYTYVQNGRGHRGTRDRKGKTAPPSIRPSHTQVPVQLPRLGLRDKVQVRGHRAGPGLTRSRIPGQCKGLTAEEPSSDTMVPVRLQLQLQVLGKHWQSCEESAPRAGKSQGVVGVGRVVWSFQPALQVMGSCRADSVRGPLENNCHSRVAGGLAWREMVWRRCKGPKG